MEPIRLSRAQVREVDRIAIEEYGVPGVVLMENAARQLAEIAHHFRNLPNQQILIVCGSGNNAGDGYAAARHLHNWGHRVTIVALKPIDDLTGDARIMADVARKMRINITDDLNAIAGSWDLILDAIFGTGLSRAPAGDYADAIDRINEMAAAVPVIAVDIPSGLDCDTGEALGACVEATSTVTFVAEKIGFAKAGLKNVRVVDIGAPVEIVDRVRAEV
jgi:NAD(P)H-hydrate epimerase